MFRMMVGDAFRKFIIPYAFGSIEKLIRLMLVQLLIR